MSKIEEAAVSDNEKQYVTFELDGQTYGVNVTEVHEVIRMVGMSESPEALPYVVGLVNIRGEVVPVVDMRSRLRLGTAKYTLATPIMVTRNGDTSAGLVVDRVLEVITLPDSAIEQSGHTFSNSFCLVGVAKKEAKLIFILNLAGIFTAEEAQILEELTDTESLPERALA